MTNYKFGIDISTDDGKKDIIKKISNDMYDIVIRYRTTRTIHRAYSMCILCSTIFMLFEFFENYHDIIMILPELHKLKRVISIKLNEFLNTINSQKDTICLCNVTEAVDIDQDSGCIHYVGRIYDDSLHYHYELLSSSPYFLNQAEGWSHYRSFRNYEVMDDNFLQIIFNEDDTLNPYDPQYETPYNTRIHYRLKNKNFLKMAFHNIITIDDQKFTDCIIYRDLDMVVNEIKFWREYYRKPHKAITVTMMALNKCGINMDCIYNIIKFI